VSNTATSLPLYRQSIDWATFDREHPAPDVWSETVFRWSPDRIRALQEKRFAEVMKNGWRNEFYRKRWTAAGLAPGDIRGLEDIGKLPTFTSDDVKDDQRDHPPYGEIAGIDARTTLKHAPLKMHTSGGTTGKARPALAGPTDWEVMGLSVARTLYMQGGRPGDVLQIPSTCALAQFGWVFYKAAHDYLGILPLTTGSGVVTPGRKQVEMAFDHGTNIIASFPEYLTTLARICREDFGRSPLDLALKCLPTYLGPDTDGLLRKHLQELFGCPVYDNYGCNELANMAFEGVDQDGLYILEDLMYIEILDTETGLPVAPGEPGNVVGTSLYRNIPPIIRFNVRDLNRMLGVGGSLGSGMRRLDHFLGRSDDMIKIRGTNVYPMACLNAVQSDPRTTGEWVCIAERRSHDGELRDELIVRVAIRDDAGGVEGLKEHLAARLKVDLGVRVEVEFTDEHGLDELANLGREGKPRRLVDRRKV